MDPLTAIGAVASIWQIAQAALSLSKTLYTLGGAVGSASEDIQLLADDLKTFSQSLTLLSRLLEDSKSWYSDDIYLLTAKIIKDCADLYVKIDKILEKLGGNGKRAWKVRVKFVYKESQIQKLLSRLRDMKGTLATILMSLQVDLQLSLLNISSTSKIQRPPERPLQPDTLRALQEASKSIMAGGILTKYTIRSEEIIQVSEKRVHMSTTQCMMEQLKPPNTFSALSTTAHSASGPPQLGHSRPPSRNFNARSFVALPPHINDIPSVVKREPLPTSIPRMISTSKKALDGGKLQKSPSSPHQVSSSQQTPDNDHAATRSLKSSSSAESFKSAISIQEQDLEVARKVKAVQSIMHAFRTAIQILGNLIESRISDTDAKLFSAAEGLEQSLIMGSNKIEQHHINHLKQHGQAYLQLFGPTTGPDKIQSMGSELMKNIVMKLHEYSAEYEDLHASQFDDLSRRSDDISIRAVHHLTQLASKLAPNSRTVPESAHTQQLHGINWFARQNAKQLDAQLFGDYREHRENILDQFDDSFFSNAFPLPESGHPFKSDLIQLVDEKQNEDEDAIPGENKSQMLTCNTIWDRLQACQKVKDGEINLDLLCNDLQKKAKYSESGAVVNESDFNKIMKSYLDEKSAKPDHDEDEMPELFYYPDMGSPPLNQQPPAVSLLPQNSTPQVLPAGSYKSNHYSHSYSSGHYHPSSAGENSPQSMLAPASSYAARSTSLSSYSDIPPPNITLAPQRTNLHNSKPTDNYAEFVDDDESDLEAAAGLEAMRIAEEQACEISDSEYKHVDLGLVGGGYDAHMSYGDSGEIHPFPSFEAAGVGKQSSRTKLPSKTHRPPLAHKDRTFPKLPKSSSPSRSDSTYYGIPAPTVHTPGVPQQPNSTSGLLRPSSQSHRMDDRQNCVTKPSVRTKLSSWQSSRDRHSFTQTASSCDADDKSLLFDLSEVRGDATRAKRKDIQPGGPPPGSTPYPRDQAEGGPAGLQDSGFDPNITISDPSFHKRDSPPGFDGPGIYRTPFAETLIDLDALPSPGIGSEEYRSVIVEVTNTPKGLRSVSSPDETFETPTTRKLSKKEQKKRDKEAAREATLAEEDLIKHTTEQIIDDPESYADIFRKSSKESKEDAEANAESDAKEDMDAKEESGEEGDNAGEDEQSTTSHRRKRRRERRNQFLDVEAEVEEEERATNSSATNEENIFLPEIHTDSEEEVEGKEDVTRSWTNSRNLQKRLVQQEAIDPAAVFGHPGPLDMGEVFRKSQERFHKFRPRINSNGVSEVNIKLDAMREDLEIHRTHRGEKRYQYDDMDTEFDEEKEGGSSSLDLVPTSTKNLIHSAPVTDQSQQPPLTISKEYQEYQGQLLATVPSFTTHDDVKSWSYPQPIELTPAQIEQQEQAARDYRLSLMPGHDPDSKESKDAHSKALQDYQMSLMVLDCGKHNTRRLMMRRISDDNVHITSDLSKVTPQRAAIPQDTSFPMSFADAPGLDVLQDFDFDSFLYDASNPDSTFQYPELSDPDQKLPRDENSNSPNMSKDILQQNEAAPGPQPLKSPASGATREDDILFVNQKQFHRIIKRRMARQQLADHLATKKRKIGLPSASAREAQGGHETETGRLNIEIPEATQRLETEPEILKSLHTTLPLRPAHSSMDVEKDVFVDEQVELATTYPALSPAQTSKLWWQAYISLISTSSSESLSFTTIKHGLESELGVLVSRHVPDYIICRRISTNVRRLGTALHDDKSQFVDVLEIRSNILRILTTIDEQLGLEIATLGWSCVYVLLSLYEEILTAYPPTQIPATFLQASFSHLQIVVSIIARYAVMENLYQQSGGALSLKPEYRSALLSLCSDILQYFATAFAYAEDEVNPRGPERELGEVRVSSMPVSLAEGGWQGSLQRCGFLVELIKQKDIVCQGFKVVVDTKAESSDESESGEADIEDVSDEDWERIEGVEIGAGVDAQMGASA